MGIIGGEAFAMSPAPTTRHQRILTRLGRRLLEFFDGKPCEVFPALTDVKLSEEDIVQPDLAVVCDPRQVRHTHIEGAPALVVEILSPFSATRDRARKLPLYAASGVTEVWLVTPYPWMAEVFVLVGDRYRLERAYEKDGTLESPTFPGLAIRLDEVFDYPIDPDERIERIKEAYPPYGGTPPARTASGT